MPTSARSRASARPSAGSGAPSTSMLPPSIGSSRLIVRHSVDLPDPDGPSTTTTSPRATSRLMFRSTGSDPKRLWTPIIRIIGVAALGGELIRSSRRDRASKPSLP